MFVFVLKKINKNTTGTHCCPKVELRAAPQLVTATVPPLVLPEKAGERLVQGGDGCSRPRCLALLLQSV